MTQAAMPLKSRKSHLELLSPSRLREIRDRRTANAMIASRRLAEIDIP
jgi:hypothetical protein